MGVRATSLGPPHVPPTHATNITNSTVGVPNLPDAPHLESYIPKKKIDESRRAKITAKVGILNPMSDKIERKYRGGGEGRTPVTTPWHAETVAEGKTSFELSRRVLVMIKNKNQNTFTQKLAFEKHEVIPAEQSPWSTSVGTSRMLLRNTRGVSWMLGSNNHG